MIKRIILAIIAVIMIVTGSAMLAYGQETNIDTYNIEITTNDNLSVVESLTVDTDSNDTMIFWIQEFPTNLNIWIDGNNIEYYTTILMGDNRYICNISGLDITKDTIIQLTYNLDKDTNKFEKILQYNTSLISITFDGKQIFTGADLKKGSSFTVELQKYIQGSTPIETIPSWIYIVIVILIVLLIVLFTMSVKKQKSTTKKEGVGGSEELLATKKSLLMETLKEIEKRHRDKQISDDTYHKLKDVFKQDAVEAMRQLEDLKK